MAFTEGFLSATGNFLASQVVLSVILAIVNYSFSNRYIFNGSGRHPHDREMGWRIDAWLAAAAVFAYQYFFSDVPPVFDGMWYFRCVKFSLEHFSFRDLNCFDHPSFFYNFILYVGYLLPIEFNTFYHFFHASLGVVGIVSFKAILDRFP